MFLQQMLKNRHFTLHFLSNFHYRIQTPKQTVYKHLNKHLPSLAYRRVPAKGRKLGETQNVSKLNLPKTSLGEGNLSLFK